MNGRMLPVTADRRLPAPFSRGPSLCPPRYMERKSGEVAPNHTPAKKPMGAMVRVAGRRLPSCKKLCARGVEARARSGIAGSRCPDPRWGLSARRFAAAAVIRRLSR